MTRSYIQRDGNTAVRRGAITGVVVCIALLSGCGGVQMPGFLQSGQADSARSDTTSTRLVERDVEAPEIFDVSDQGLWDGRPSLGGVWVAHPDVTEPERVIIRNQENGKFVIGALFRRERELPGPNLQISSDAAQALGILAGAPAPLNVVALRREDAETPADAVAAEQTVQAPAEVIETPLAPAEAGTAPAAAALSPAPVAAAPIATPPAATAPTAAAAASSLEKPFVQIGIFSVEANAERAANQMRGADLSSSVRESQINGKSFWRVVVGPARTATELSGITAKIKAEGFSDAYAVTN